MKNKEQIQKKLKELRDDRSITPKYQQYEFASTVETLRTPESESLDAQIGYWEVKNGGRRFLC